MDYTQVPPDLIYRVRYSLENFDAYEKGSITRPFAEEMLKLRFSNDTNTETNALWCMNTAFYICTMILLEKDPRWRIDKYKEIATRTRSSGTEIYRLTTLSMVVLLLQRLGDSLKKHHKYADDVRHELLIMIHRLYDGDKIFNCFSKRLNKDTSISQNIPISIFAPRVIDKEAIDDAMMMENFNWAHFTTYWNKQRLREIIKSLGTTEEEKHNVVDILRQTSHGFYSKGLRYDEVDDILDDIDNEIKVQFNPGGKKISKETPKTDKGKQVDIKLYENRIKELEEENEDLIKQIKKLEKQLDEANTIPDSITAQQRVRMELARLLMEKAGIDKTLLDKWGNKDKAGTIMSIILDIPPTTSKTFLSDPTINKGYHKETILNINTLLEALELDFRP